MQQLTVRLSELNLRAFSLPLIDPASIERAHKQRSQVGSYLSR
jgi:hypothetical protein